MTTSPRPKRVNSITFHEKTHCGPIYVTVGYDEESGKVIEVFAAMGKAGACGSSVMDGMTRVISYGLRAGMEPERVFKALAGIQCHQGPDTCCNAVAVSVQTVVDQLKKEVEVEG